MPIYIDQDKCNGCGNSKEPPCVRMCPGDLNVKDFVTGKAYLRSKEDCWNCYACVKPCPQEAIEMRLSYQLGYFNAKVQPHIISSDTIEWECVDTKGNVEIFRMPTKYIPVALDEEPSEDDPRAGADI
ncbi:MAG: 4Fe-4S dicluster domain-containing protein [Deltaproteobacteria bacterium]|nr:4Fe-4S dicluster domain-containing protein [Deltaproteobacteria bacterium]